MTGIAIDDLVTWTITGLELAALAVIAGGFVWSVVKAIALYVRHNMEDRYTSFRRELGRCTLIALELLVAADILRSLVLEPSLTNIAVLGGLVTIRTFLSFSIDVELDGCWPWERARARVHRTAQ